MVEAQEKDAIEKGMQTLWFIWAAMLGSLLIYVFLCYQLSETIRSSAGSDSFIELFRNILFGVGAVTFFIAFFFEEDYALSSSGAAQVKIECSSIRA